MSAMNLGFSGGSYPFGKPEEYMQFGLNGAIAAPYSGGYDPAGVWGRPEDAAPYGGDYNAATEYGAADPMAIISTDKPIEGPKFKKAKPKWQKRAKGVLDVLSGLGQDTPPPQHHQFKTMGLLGRM